MYAGVKVAIRTHAIIFPDLLWLFFCKLKRSAAVEATNDLFVAQWFVQ
jgi:hypothetical protein